MRPLRELLASEVAAVLIDLAAFTRAACAGQGHLDTISHEMLKRVLAFCQAQRGAVLLSGDHEHPRTHEKDARSAAVPPKALRALALHHTQEEEASALLHGFTVTNTHLHSPGLTCWITYALHEVTAASAGERDDAFEAPSAAASRAEQGQHAFLVLGWAHESDEACAALVARCQRLLPRVADAIGEVVASIVLKERVQALAGMELLKAELLGTVSHELRSPPASIKGYAATMLRPERHLAREERHQFLLAINEASDRLEVIIERLLEVSQLETGQVALQRSPVDVAHLTGEAIAALEERVKRCASPIMVRVFLERTSSASLIASTALIRA